MHRTPRLLLVVLSLAALLLSACGGGVGGKSAEGVLKETFGPGKSVKSGKLDLRISFNGQGLQAVQGPLKASLTGPFSSSGSGKLPKFAFDANLDIGGQSVAAGAISTGTKAFLKFGGTNFAVDDATYAQFARLYAQDQKNGTKQKKNGPLGIDPLSWLASPKKVADEDVGGVKTVHVTSQVDVPAFLTDVNTLLGRADATGAAAAAGATGPNSVPSKLTDAQRKQIISSVKNATFDVFAGKDDGILRRLNVQITFDVPASARKGSNGLTTGTFGLDLVISGLNEKQEIKAPANARPLSDLKALGAASGATGTGGAAPSSGAADGGGAAAPQLDPTTPEGKYAACLQAAGQSIEKAQKCAPLLNGGG